MLEKDTITHEYKLIGSGEKSIIFLNGFRMKFESWNMVYPEILTNHKVLLFNRSGVGKSMKAQVAQTGKCVVEEIHKLLSKLEMNLPYIFVTHSLGGIFANLYARTYQNDVSGIIFVDTPHPSEIAKQKKIRGPFFLRVINEGLKKAEKLLDKYKYSEDECIEETVTQIQNMSYFPHIPIAIVSGTKKMPLVSQEAFILHQEYQTKILELSSHSKQYYCHKSGHFPQITEPEVVISAIFDISNKT